MSVPVVGKIPFMIFGADVTHPTSFNENDPSIAAVCASYDRSLGRYMSRVLRQVSGYDRGTCTQIVWWWSSCLQQSDVQGCMVHP